MANEEIASEKLQTFVEETWEELPEFIGVKVKHMVYSCRVGQDRYRIYLADYYGREVYLAARYVYGYVYGSPTVEHVSNVVDIGSASTCVLHTDKQPFVDHIEEKRKRYM